MFILQLHKYENNLQYGRGPTVKLTVTLNKKNIAFLFES